jgi:hypothetical protein
MDTISVTKLNFRWKISTMKNSIKYGRKKGQKKEDNAKENEGN